MWVDFHWHARDGKQSHKDTVKRSLELAYAAGGLAIGAMPNTDPPLTTLELCRDYLKLAKDANVREVQFYTHISLTSDPEQIKRAVEAYRKESGICGMKAYFGRSTGNLSVVSKKDQERAIKTLAEEGYEGVLAGHFEKESLMDDKAYDPRNPRTWNTKCRPEIAEMKSFCDILRLSHQYNFRGTLHVAHISTLIVADYIHRHKEGVLKLSCGVTPHHAFLNDEYLKGKKWAWYKCNPPLRSRSTQEGLLQRLVNGTIPIIESDHAPHTCEDKKAGRGSNGKKKKKDEIKLPASGIASGTIWSSLERALLDQGMAREILRGVMRDNAIKLYGLEGRIPMMRRNVDWKALEKISSQYPHDPFSRLFDEGVFKRGW